MGGSPSKTYPDSRVIDTAYGKVIGRRLLKDGDKQVDAFQGIPYARAPIGELRFKKPVPPEPWEGVRETKKFGHRSIQKDIFSFGYWKTGSTSEDCLMLNVYTPCWKPPPEGFAVMVFVHGGGFSMGDSVVYGDIGICETLCTKDVVVVTIQYRLGYLGFWTTGNNETCPSNLGLWDQCEALKWIQLNIGAFGGNKDNVTILGQSAGGVSVDLLSLSPHSSGLFHKVIPMGGTASAKWAISPHMKKQCEKRAKKMKITEWSNDEELMEKLRKLPAEAFSINMFNADLEKGADLEITPTIDGDFLPSTVASMRKTAPPKPRMTGVAKMEALMFLLTAKRSPAKLRKLVGRAIPEEIPERERIIDEFIREYIDLNKKATKKEVFRAMNEVFSDLATNAATLGMIQQTLEANPDTPVYSYVFSHTNPKHFGPLRWYLSIVEATHGMELPYLFGRSMMFKFTFNEQDKRMCEMFGTAFTNFAKYGNPNGPKEQSVLPILWEPSTIDNPEIHYVFDLEPEIVDTYFKGRPTKLLEIRSALTEVDINSNL